MLIEKNIYHNFITKNEGQRALFEANFKSAFNGLYCCHGNLFYHDCSDNQFINHW